MSVDSSLETTSPVILKFAGHHFQDASAAIPRCQPTSVDCPHVTSMTPQEEPIIFSLREFLRIDPPAMPPLYQIDLIEAQYSQFLEESQSHVESSARLWDSSKPGTIRAM